MTGLIDTHCHLYMEAFDADRETCLEAARQSGIEKILVPNVDMTTVDRLHALCDRHPSFALPMMGLHPTSVDEAYVSQLQAMEALLRRRTYCAIGETGIDLYWDKSRLAEQKEAFEVQLRWSIEYDLPVVIHTRKAFPEVFDSLYKVGAERLKGVFHCFSGTEADLREIERLKTFKLGIGGVVTYTNAHLPKVLAHTGIDRIVLETDAPYLPPVPYRGKRNEPLYIWETVARVAAVYDLSLEETVSVTRQNTLDLFKI